MSRQLRGEPEGRQPVAQGWNLLYRRFSIGSVSAVVAMALWAGTAARAVDAAEPVVSPLAQAHAHNDYEHPRPLLDALARGFCSVEADIHLVAGQLLVAHDLAQVRPDRTLERLYLDPLRERVQANRGRVYAQGPAFFLLIDFKSNGPATWQALRPVLAQYAEMLTTYRADRTEPKAVTVVLSGNSPREQLAQEPTRLAGIDGRLNDLPRNPSPHLVPWISDNWPRHFQWRGAGEMPVAERTRLRDLVAQAHAQGRQVRFWGAPDQEPIWQEQFLAGVDFINTDKLDALRQFLLRQPAGVPPNPAP